MSDFKLPDLGENIESGDVVSVLVGEGDVIKAQQDVIELETDKAVISVPSDVGGKVTKIHVAKGQSVKPGQVILSVDAAAAGSAPAAKAPLHRLSNLRRPPSPLPNLNPRRKQKLHQKPAAPQAKPAPARPAATAAPVAPPKQSRPAPAGGNGHSAAVEPAPARASAASTPVETSDEDGQSTSAPAGPAVRRLARELGVDLVRVSGTGDDGRITREDVINAVRHANAVVSSASRRRTFRLDGA